jgi:glycosyltransferase involved in cell wall biosynthesis
MGKIEILQVSKLYFPWLGGVETHVQDLSEHLARYDDLSLRVLVCNDVFAYKDEWISGVRVKKLANVLHLFLKRVLLFSTPVSLTFPFWLRQMKADILHFHLPNPLAVLAYFLVRPRGKLVVTWHSDIVKQKKLARLLRPLEEWFLRKADLILATSPNMITHSSSLAKFREKCRVVPLGINANRYGEPAGMEARDHAKKAILFVGRLVYYKGVHVLVEAMRGVDAELIIIGRGPLHDELIAAIKANGLEDRISIIPPVPFDKLIEYYYRSDVFILPSIASSEAFGIVQLEAMACGKPVISTNLPTGVPFVNEHGKTGLVVKPGDASELREAIRVLLGDDGLRLRMGECARNRVLAEFTNDRVAERVRSIYKSLLQSPPHTVVDL